MTTTINSEILAAVVARARAEAERQAAAGSGRKGKAPRPCACGCGSMTRGGKWHPGDDGIVSGIVHRATLAGRDPMPEITANAARLARLRGNAAPAPAPEREVALVGLS